MLNGKNIIYKGIRNNALPNPISTNKQAAVTTSGRSAARCPPVPQWDPGVRGCRGLGRGRRREEREKELKEGRKALIRCSR